MFDDPKKRLEELDAALKAAQAEEELDWLQDAKDFLAELDEDDKAPESVNLPRTKYADEDMYESSALYVEAPKRKGAGGYMVLALLELIAIGLIGLWWLKWTL